MGEESITETKFEQDVKKELSEIKQRTEELKRKTEAQVS